MNISAEEINRQSVRLQEQLPRFISASKTIRGELSGASNKIYSEDTNLAIDINKAVSILENLEALIPEKFNELSGKMKSYAEKTKANEQETSETTRTVSDELDESLSVLQNLRIGGIS